MSKEKLDILENILFLKKNPLFSTMNTRELKAVASICNSHSFAKGETIVTQGDVGDSMYLIKSGEVSITHTKEGDTVQLATLKAGESLGEMAMFEAEIRTASAVAHVDSELLSIENNDFIDLLQIYPGISLGVIKTLVKRLRNTIHKVQELAH